VHLNIEARLTALVGDAGKRLHTGRSRNDQVATDVRLWLRGEIDRLAPLLAEMQRALVDLADGHAETVMPGFTHLQVAQPVSFAHHLLAYVEMFARDAERLADCAGASTGCRWGRPRWPAPATRWTASAWRASWASRAVRQQPGRRQRPRLRARVHRLRQHLHGARVAAGRGDRALDEPELRLHRPGRPLLHRQLDHAAEAQPRRGRAGARQERPRDRPPDGAADADEGPAADLQQGQPGGQGAAVRHRRHAGGTLRIMAEMVGGSVDPATGARSGGLRVKADAMRRAAQRGYATATDLADYLVGKGLPFRDAHEAVAGAVKAALGRGLDLSELPLAELQALHPAIGADVAQVLSLRGLAGRPQGRRRHGAGAGARGDRGAPGAARLSRARRSHGPAVPADAPGAQAT
jgi:argininosuccinate lyase